MRIITPDSRGRILLGRVGEAGAEQVQISVAGWEDLYGSGTFTLVHQRSQDSAAYPIVVTVEDETVKWNVSSSDVQYEGLGQAELIYTVGSVIAKSVIFQTICSGSLDGTATPPSAWQSWVDSVIAAKNAAVAAQEAIENMSAQASIDGNVGTPSVTVTKSTISGHEDLAFAFHNLKGNGITSIAKTGTSGLTDTYTITYADGTTTTYTVMNGSGIASIEKTGTSGLVDTYTITYENGNTKTYTVTNGNGIASAVLNADYTLTLTFTNGTTYTTPSIRGEKGEKGNVNFATFEVLPATGRLVMTTDEEYSGANFSLNNSGYLEVTI